MDRRDADARIQVFERLLDFLNRLDAARVRYTLGHTGPESVMVDIALRGWRWEVEFMVDGSIEIERYQSVTGVEDDPQFARGTARRHGSPLALSGMTGRPRGDAARKCVARLRGLRGSAIPARPVA
jgi:hypothetical protein